MVWKGVQEKCDSSKCSMCPGNRISEIFPENWRGLENSLQTLILVDNTLSSLPPDAFSNLPNLETLDMSGNDLLGFDPSTFHNGPARLSSLYLADNQLTSIPYQQVSALRLLRTLDLSGNMISHLHSATSEPEQPGVQLSLDTLRLDYNQIQYLPPGSFQHFDILNRTFLDGNPLFMVEADAFRDARIRELSLRDCGVTALSPGAFSGLEPSLQLLDLAGNNLTVLPNHLFHDFDFLRTLYLAENRVAGVNPGDALNGFQYSLYRLDFSGRQMGVTALHDLRRIRNLRSIILSKIPQNQIGPDDFVEFGVDLEEIKIQESNLKTLKNHAFKHVRGLKRLDLSENNIKQVEPDAFVEVTGLSYGLKGYTRVRQLLCHRQVGHSLTFLRVAHGFSSSVSSVPSESLKPLVNLQYLDLSNNRLSSMPETSFHFLRKLRILELQDNQLDQVHKGTFQGGIHSSLEKLYLSYNNLNSINTHTFVDLSSLERLHLDDNKINRLERRAFMNMDRLKYLDLRGNKIQSISDEAFQNLPELQTLDLAYNELKGFDFAAMDQVGVLASFRLNMSHNRMQSLEVNVSSLSGREGGLFHSNIKVLDMSHNNISWIARGYLRPLEISVTHLYLGNNALQNATREVFGNMPHLQWLDLSGNSISELDFDVFRNTRRLQVVRLDRNLLTDIPSELFRSLSSLRVVDLSSNRLRNLPDGLFMDEGMESLTVSHNQLGRVPASCLGTSAAATLVEMDLSHNLIASLQGSEMFNRLRVTITCWRSFISFLLHNFTSSLLRVNITCWRSFISFLLHNFTSSLQGVELSNRLRSLSRLDLSSNKITRIDDGTFSPLNRLAHLDLSHNQGMLVENKGRGFKGLEDSLLYLGLANCSMGSVPELPLHGLRSLDLSHNYFPDMPLEMTVNMTSLRRLDLSYNELSTVPMVAQSLPQLRELSLAGNPITSLTNTTMIGGAQRLKELDIRQLPLNFFETGALSKMTSLRTLHLSPFKGVRHFNIPQVILSNSGLRQLHVECHEHPGLQDEMNGVLPRKVRNITMSGEQLRSLPHNLLQGVRSPRLHFVVRNSSLDVIPRSVFQEAGWARNLTVDVRHNSLRTLGNPSTADFPGLPRATFLTDLQVADNRWSCDCDIGYLLIYNLHPFMISLTFTCTVGNAALTYPYSPLSLQACTMESFHCKSAASSFGGIRYRLFHHQLLSWVEVWQRKKRQYLCGEEDSEERTTCRRIDDDLRLARCANKNNASLIEVLKADVECGWGSSAGGPDVTTPLVVIAGIIAMFANI
uniref:Chaoptin n=1 Tax=Timema tahoe TaxID=61484 RepID=A0A7R9FGV2_9NEOP|nr:unnamed protein product [Timema tahoe]